MLIARNRVHTNSGGLLTSRGFTSASSTVAADDFHGFINDKVAGLRASKDGEGNYTVGLFAASCPIHTADADATQLSS